MPEADPTVSLIAFFLPQFHPIPENDAWWGRGFTEWANVAKTRPLFPGHRQPVLPADLGFYDLRLPETRQAQADLARAHGVTAFCWYHYWFSGRRVLERPFDDVLASGRPDFPFVLCWANENWTRVWDGGDDEILLGQDYSPEDDRAHLESLLPAFDDPRYLRVEGRPVFLVYHASRIPDPAATAGIWREVARAHGLPDLYLARVDRFDDDAALDPRAQGFDVAVEFQPDGRGMPRELPLARAQHLLQTATRGRFTPRFSLYDYADVVASRPGPPAWPRHPCVTPGWDNSPRRKRGATVFHRSSPEVYEAWLQRTVSRVLSSQGLPRLVFVNAWNEWAEGAHLEPDTRTGLAYLEATRRVMSRALLEPGQVP